MKGADQCPRCGSRRWADIENTVADFYGRTLRVCGNCRTAWESFDQADLLDADDRYSSFLEPCDNCAFRPGSHEQRDREEWKSLIERLGWPGDFPGAGRFYCHKGVPLDPEYHHGDSGYAYPVDAKGKYVTKRFRLCRGYLKVLGRKPAVIRESLLSDDD